MTATTTLPFWATMILGLALMGCPTDPNDTAPEGDADTDADADGDTDADSDADTDVYANILTSVLDKLPTSFSVYDDFDPLSCEDVEECNIGVDEPRTVDLFAKREYTIFGDKTIDVNAPGQFEGLWGEGEFGTDFSGDDWVETAEDDGIEGFEHEVEVTKNGEFVEISISRSDGCQHSVTMSGLEFAYDGGDGYSCVGYGTADRRELFIDGSHPSGSYRIHLVRD